MSLFKRIRVPNIVIPKKGRETAAKIAKDFATFVESATEEYNRNNGEAISPAEGLAKLLDSGQNLQQIVDENPEKVAIIKSAIGQKWGKEKGFKSAHRFVNPRFTRWFVYHVLPHYRPDLAKALIEHPKGEEWMNQFVTTFKKIAWDK